MSDKINLAEWSSVELIKFLNHKLTLLEETLERLDLVVRDLQDEAKIRKALEEQEQERLRDEKAKQTSKVLIWGGVGAGIFQAIAYIVKMLQN